MTLRHTAGLVTLAVLLAARDAGADPVPATTPPAGVRGAIAAAVVSRLGGGALATVTSLQTTVGGDARPLTASPEPGARTARPARFALFADGQRVGTAVATVHVNARYVRARRALGRDEAIAAADVEEVDGPLRDEPLRRLPALDEVVGAHARRPVAVGEAVTTTLVRVAPVVRSGDTVTVAVRIGAVQAEGRGVASGSGHVGDVIRVVNAGSRRPLAARITGPGQVEIVQ